MADTKISALTALTGANVASATDVLAIVDTSVTTTKKITRAELFDISDSGGGQIVFPAAQNASAGANTLDDYEEGTSTPTDGSGAGLSFSAAASIYTKIGRQVSIAIDVTYPSTADSSNAAIVLPFTNSATGLVVVGAAYTTGGTTPFAVCRMTTNTNAMSFVTTNGTVITNANLSGLTIHASVVLFV